MISFAGLVFAIAFMSFFMWLFCAAYNFALKYSNENLLNDIKSKFIFIIFVFAGAWMCYWLISQNRTIYTWDYSQYWTHSFSQMRFLFSDPLLAILRLGGTILFADYNSILPTIIALPMKLFGITYTRYVLINYMFFLVPVSFILIMTVKVISSKHNNHAWLAFMLFMFLTFNPFYHALLRGYIDIACLIPASLSMLLLKDYDALSLSREQIKRDVYISAMLLCTLMFRRYFVFFIQGYIAALVLLSLHSVINNSDGRAKLKLLKNAVLNIIIIGLFAAFILCVFFAPMVMRIMRTKYTEIYSAYDASFMNKIQRVLGAYGYITFILSAAGVILSLVRKRMRRYSCFCLISLIVTALTFFQVQSMGVHHIYILASQLFIMSCIGAIHTAEILRKKAAKISAFALIALILSAGFTNCYFPSARPLFSKVSGFFSMKYNPLVRNDIHVLNDFADYLNEITEGTDKGIYIASSGLFALMESLRKPYEACPVRNLLKVFTVDLVNGFPTDLLRAGVFAAVSPVRTDQEIIKFPSLEIMSSDSRLGKHFRKNERTFRIDGGSEIIIYEKQSEFTQEDLQYVADHFTKIYPGREELFAKRILSAGKSGIGEALSHRWSPKVVYVLRWLLVNNIFTPEQLAAASNRTVYEIKQLLEE